MSLKEISYKENIVSILLRLLEIASIETKSSINFEQDYMKYLKFQNEVDWKRYRASLDLLVDTEYAIQNVFEYQLGKKENNNKGENYLRLYGVLNAVYLQMSAYKEISMLLNYPIKNTVESNFNKLDIYRLRNIAASHTVNYKYDKTGSDGSKVSKTYRIMQASLECMGSSIIVLSENSEILKYNLLELLTEYEKVSRDLLVNLANHAINKLVFKKEYREKLKGWLKEALENLIDYSTVNKNI